MGGLPNHKYAIEVSTDLVNWTTLTTVTATEEGAILFLDDQAGSFGKRYYCARAL
jgi:hypothetical protein